MIFYIFKSTGCGLHTNNYFEERVLVPDYLKVQNEKELLDFVFTAESLMDPLRNVPDLKGSAILVPLLSEVKRYAA